MRERAEAVIGAAEPRRYLETARALERWSATDRLGELRCRTLLIAAEFDYTPLAEKRALATLLRAPLVEVRGSRHGTPFDAIDATNECLVAHLTDGDLPPIERHSRDTPERAPSRPDDGSVAEEHATAA